MKKIVFIIVTMLCVACSSNKQNNNITAEMYLFAGNKISEYYGFDSYKLDITECDFSYPSNIQLTWRDSRMKEARADYMNKTITKAEYETKLNELFNGCTEIVMQWRNNIPDTTDQRVMYKCEADSGIVFYMLLDKDNKTPVCTSMDIERQYAEIVEQMKQYSK